MLFAEREHHALALASSAPWLARSVGFVGVSDGWQELHAHKRLDHTYARAENGNVAVTGEIDLVSCDGTFVMALGFGPTAMEAGQHALITLLEDFDETHRPSTSGAWQAWHARLVDGVPPKQRTRLYQISAAVLRTHESKRVEGGIIASLSIPWGFSKPDDDLGGYHLVWPRDLVEIAGGFIAIGAHEHVRRVLRYLQVTQEPDGHWSQNMWLDGTARTGTACRWTKRHSRFSSSILRRARASSTRQDGMRCGRWCAGRPCFSRATVPSVRRTDGRNNRDTRRSPLRPRSRRSSSPPISPTRRRTPIAADYLRETADAWNASIERWLYVEGTELAQLHGVDGYYVRVAQPDHADAASPCQGFVPIKNRPPDQATGPAALMVSLDALAFVRFGLRAPRRSAHR